MEGGEHLKYKFFQFDPAPKVEEPNINKKTPDYFHISIR